MDSLNTLGKHTVNCVNANQQRNSNDTYISIMKHFLEQVKCLIYTKNNESPNKIKEYPRTGTTKNSKLQLIIWNTIFYQRESTIESIH